MKNPSLFTSPQTAFANFVDFAPAQQDGLVNGVGSARTMAHITAVDMMDRAERPRILQQRAARWARRAAF